jgi:hypothetical protein
MTREFRGQPVFGWQLVKSPYQENFLKELNALMEEYNFVDCQFSTEYNDDIEEISYIALVLLAKKS